jgi:CheY-like chemotaxis protein
MSTDTDAFDAIVEKMRGSFLADAAGKLDNLDRMVDALWERKDAPAGAILDELRRVIHSLKGLGGTFRYPQVSIVCHHMEGYLEGAEALSEGQLEDIQGYLDCLRQGLDMWPPPGEAEIAAILVDLPQRRQPPAPTVARARASVLLVSPSGAIAQLAAFFLEDLNCAVTSIDDPFSAFRAAIQKAPRLVISSVVLPDLSGLDFIAALRATSAMANTRFALLSSSSDIAEMTGGAAAGVAVIATETLEDGLRDVVASLG